LDDDLILIGKGAFGEVFKGKLFGTDCAVKIIKPSLESTIGEINHEIGIMGDTHHPNLVSLLGTCRKNGSAFIITEFVDNGCLRGYLEKTVLTVKMIISMALDIARGMAWLHSRKPPIFHRDLHSKNVLVTSKQTCKVCDFGLSRVKGEIFHSSRLYKRIIPPELVGSDCSNYTAPADVYMFGLVLYELITRSKAPNVFNFEILDDLLTKVDKEIYFLVEIIKLCTSELPDCRPPFESIIKQLEKQHETQVFSIDKLPLLPPIIIGY